MNDRTRAIVYILLLLIVALALGLRLYRLETQSLWYDEGFSAYLARMDLSAITARTAADIQPPLYYYLLHGWIDLFGDSEGALRGLSVLFGVLSVPLIYALAWQLFRDRWAGLLAALFLAISPLQVWYGQEARMYTLLTFLCLLSSHLLVLIGARARRVAASEVANPWLSGALWAAYTAVTILAIYTHYFAFFILAFQAVYLLLVWVSLTLIPPPGVDGRERNDGALTWLLVGGGLISGAVILLAYVPWVPHVLNRYGADLSYWPGQLKLHEVLVDIGLSFVGGESVPEEIGLWLALGLVLIATLCLVALVLKGGRKGQRSAVPHVVAFLLLYLLLPPALILILSYNTPKFNARYALVSHPALLLLLAGGLAALWAWRSRALGNAVRQVTVALSVLFLLAVAGYANHNAYTDPAFARADFRGVAGYIAEHIEPDETIILLSGHMFPVYDYYAPGIERHLLPDSPTLDATRTLDYGVAADLIDWLFGMGGVWVVLWQDEVVDPAGYLLSILDDVGEEQPIDQTFPKVGLRHYRLPPDARFTGEPVIAHPTDINFGHKLRLLGYTQTGEQEVTLYWQAMEPLTEDYRVSLILRDTAGQSWGRWDGRPTAYLFPTNRWRVGQVVPGIYQLVPMTGAPPGDYGLEVGVYTEEDPKGLDVLDEAGAPQGKRAMLGAVALSVPAVTAEQIEVPNRIVADVGGGLQLLGWDLEPEEAQPGDSLLLTLVWSVISQPTGDYRVRLWVTDAAGQPWDAGTFPPTNVWHPTSIWLPGQAWRGQMTFRLPNHAQEGQGRLAVQLLDASGVALGAAVELAPVHILATSRIFEPPQPQAARHTNFDARIALVGADMEPDPVAAGDVLRITFYWQALREMDIPYTVFVHLLGPDGRVIAGHDSQPVQGNRPTTGWVPGEYIADPHEILIPDGLAAGDYVVEVGLYDAGVPSMPRLPVLSEEGEAGTDRVIFSVRVR